MSGADDESPRVVWAGKYIRAMKRGRWEYVSRAAGMTAVAIHAEVDGHVLLVEQERAAIGRRCLELPAGLVGDEDAHATILGTAAKELVEETGYEAADIVVVGEFFSSPGMISESFTLVRASGLRRVGAGGGTEHEDIIVHHVPIDGIRAFVEERRAEGCAIDARILSLTDFIRPA